MLKFFRQYNKWILGIGGSLLMIVFLIQPVMSMFTKDPNSYVLGTYEGGELTRGDLRSADGDMHVLRNFGLILDPDGGNDNNDAKRWALALKDAERLGLHASQMEVEQLKLESGKSDADIELIAARINATPSYIRHAMRNWLIIQQYKELIAAQSHLPGRQRASFMRQMFLNPQAAGLFEAMSYGSSRMSKPLVEHFLQDQGAQVTGRAVLVSADEYTGDTPKPTAEEVETLFNEYKDALPGRGKPYAFGYRVPDRVKLEYLVISIDDVRQHVKVNEADALAHYRANQDRYRGEGLDAEVKPYEAVREQVISDLTAQLSLDLVERMAKSAFGLFYEDLRSIPKKDDYRVIEDIGQLKSMREVTEALAAEYGLQPEVRLANDGAWVSARELIDLPGIGFSRLADNERVDLTAFVLSTKELEPASDNPLLPRRLQVGLASAPMMDQFGSRYIFRLTDAQPTRVPESVDEVRDQVEQDAWRLAAYKRLLAESDSWLTEAVDSGMSAVADRANSAVIDLPATARRVPLPNGLLIIPPLPMIGQSDAFIEAYFKTANNGQSNGDIAEAPADDVTGVVGIDTQLALAVYRVDAYQPMTRSEFKENAAQPIVPILIDTTVLAPARVKNPLSFDALSERMNYVDSMGGDESDEGIEGDAPVDETGEPEDT